MCNSPVDKPEAGQLLIERHVCNVSAGRNATQFTIAEQDDISRRIVALGVFAAV